MKKNIITVLSLFSILLLAACGAVNNQSGQTTAGAGQGQGFGNRPITPQLQLAVGTFKLEGTPQVVDAQTAEKLIPLWQLYGQMETNNSSAPQELNAVLDQIKEAMTPDRINAIQAMNLTGRDAFTFMQQQGIFQNDGFSFSGTPRANRTPRAGGGFQFQGGGPGGPNGGPGGGGQNLNPSQIATLQARRAQGGGFNNRLPQPLLDALIKLLQSKLTPTPTVTPTFASTPTSPADTFTATPTP